MVNLNFIFATNANTYTDYEQIDDFKITWSFPELEYSRNLEGNFIDSGVIVDSAEIHQWSTINIVTSSESILVRLKRCIVERVYPYSTWNIKCYWFDADYVDALVDAELDRYGQVQHMPKNFFDTISDDLAAYTDAVLAMRWEDIAHDQQLGDI